MKLRRSFVILVLAAACLAGARPYAQTPAAQTPTLEGYPTVGSPAAIKLIDAGAQPRKALRYAIPATFKGGMDMSMTMAMNVNVGGMAMPMNLPTMKMSADVAATSIAANGDTSYTLAFSKVDIEGGADANPMLATALQGVQSAVTGIKGTATISNRGTVKSAKIDSGDAGQVQQMIGELTSQVENLATAFPEEAVGVGAKWETRQATKTAGQVTFQKTITEIVSIEGTTVKMKYTTEQTIPPQALTNSMLPADVAVQMDGAKGTGSGAMEIHLDSLVPSGESTVTSSMSMTMTMGGQTQPMTMENTVKITIAPRPVK